MNDKDTGVWFRRKNDGGDRKFQRSGNARDTPRIKVRGWVRTRAIADAETIQSQLGSLGIRAIPTQPLMPRPVMPSPVMPRPEMPRSRMAGGIGFRGPMALSAAEPEPACSSIDNLMVAFLVCMVAFISFKQFRRVPRLSGMREPFMTA